MIVPERYQNLRKSTVFGLLFLAFFLFYRIVTDLSRPANSEEIPTGVALSGPRAEVLLCRNIVEGAPFGVDSLFEAEKSRVFAYTRLEPSGPRRLVWYHEADSVWANECRDDQELCIGSLAPERLTPGLWSVDLVDGRHLLSSRQFLVQVEQP